MRLEGLPNTIAAIKTNVADLLGKLNTGDVIKARVLEITSSEVVLRLFDGSVLKAATTEGLDAKVGQTLTLAVTSKAEGTLFLETVKDTNLKTIKPDILKSLLESLQIKPNANNMKLAAEFMKAEIPVTTNQLIEASGLMESFKGLDAEKAVFIASKGLQTDQIKLDLLTKLLDGDLKLGQQLKELQTALDNISKTIGKSVSNEALTRAIFEAVETTLAAKASTSLNITSSPLEAAIPNNTVNKAQINLQEMIPMSITNTETDTELNFTDKSSTTRSQGAAGPSVTAAGQQGAAGDSAATAGQQGATGTSAATAGLGNSNSTITAKPDLLTASNTLSASNPGDPVNIKLNDDQTTNMNNSRSKLQQNTFPATGDESASPLSTLNALIQDENINISNKAASSSPDPFIKLKDVIEELFIHIDSDQLASDLDVNKLHKELNNKLDMLKAAIQAADLSRLTGGEGISATTMLLNDSVKLLNQLNNNSMLYYQLPVNLSGHITTAELYIMKRRQNQKKIDPHNSVLYVSLDTYHLGRIETLLDVKGNTVSINLKTEKQQINDFVKENIKSLYEGLSDCGYKLVDIRYALIDSAATPVKQEQLLSKMIVPSYSKVDMRI